jgi:endogenous inhibitor of DNA gyrase (YacG/DUF329 family)
MKVSPLATRPGRGYHVDMGIENDFVRLIDSAPQVKCSRCEVAMTLRTLMPMEKGQEYRATYRCPKCGTDTQREFIPAGSLPRSLA